MGKIRIKTLGDDKAEKKQKLDAAKRKEAKMAQKATVMEVSSEVENETAKEVVTEENKSKGKDQKAKVKVKS